MKHLTKLLLALLTAFCLLLTACGSAQTASSGQKTVQNQATQTKGNKGESFDLSNIPAFSGKPYVVIHDNVPDFPDKDKTKDPDNWLKIIRDTVIWIHWAAAARPMPI